MAKVKDLLAPPPGSQWGTKDQNTFRQAELAEYETVIHGKNQIEVPPQASVCRVHYSSCPLCQTIWCDPENDAGVDQGTDFA